MLQDLIEKRLEKHCHDVKKFLTCVNCTEPEVGLVGILDPLQRSTDIYQSFHR